MQKNSGVSKVSAKYCFEAISRYKPGSQPHCSLIPDPKQNNENASFVSAVAYGVYISLSRPIHFCLLPKQNFEKNTKDPADPAEPWIQEPSGFLAIFMGFKSFHQRNPLSYNTL